MGMEKWWNDTAGANRSTLIDTCTTNLTYTVPGLHQGLWCVRLPQPGTAFGGRQIYVNFTEEFSFRLTVNRKHFVCDTCAAYPHSVWTLRNLCSGTGVVMGSNTNRNRFYGIVKRVMRCWRFSYPHFLCTVRVDDLDTPKWLGMHVFCRHCRCSYIACKPWTYRSYIIPSIMLSV